VIPAAQVFETTQTYSCVISGCSDKHYARGWCKRHYQRWRKHGDPLGGGVDRGRRQPGPFPSQPERRRIARDFVNALKKVTPCAGCGGPMLDWHNPEHIDRPVRRISRMVGIGSTLRNIKLEIARCTPLCRRCHMTEDGRIKGLVALNRKLTASDVMEIRRLAASTTRAELARRYGVQPAVISKVVLRRIWKHVA
jgi:hypothetical protein